MLLAEDEPAAFEALHEDAKAPYLVLCDHASRRIPRSLGRLGLPASELERHIAWDLGAAGLARRLARNLGAWLILQNYSRLVIDCNRPLERPDSIAEQSEDTPIPGNQGLSSEARRERTEQVFEPYHARIRAELDRRAAAGGAPMLLFVHSFTPVYRGVARPWHASVLHHRDTRLARPLLAALAREEGVNVGDNQPYAVSTLSDYGIIEHAEARGLAPLELEVRQDLLADDAGQEVWAERLARLISAAARELGF